MRWHRILLDEKEGIDEKSSIEVRYRVRPRAWPSMKFFIGLAWARGLPRAAPHCLEPLPAISWQLVAVVVKHLAEGLWIKEATHEDSGVPRAPVCAVVLDERGAS